MTQHKDISYSTVWYRVAGLVFGISTPTEIRIGFLLYSLEPFRMEKDFVPSESPLFNLTLVPYEASPETPDYPVLAEDTNALGGYRIRRTDNGYCIDLEYRKGDPVHRMMCDKEFRTLTAAVHFRDINIGNVVSSFTMMGFSLASSLFNTLMVHASVTVKDGKGYAFLGTSGTGKSTHSQQWLKCLDNTELLNDDNPAVRIGPDGKMKVYGTPWSGKTFCYKNKDAELAAFVMLKQAPHNKFRLLKGIDAYMTLLTSCSALKWNSSLYNAVGKTVEEVSNHIPIGFLECLPDEGAACLCYSELNALGNK